MMTAIAVRFGRIHSDSFASVWIRSDSFLSVRIHYDHRFEPVDENHTRLTWTVAAEGPGAGTLGRIFGAIYDRNLDKAIPNLQAEMRGEPDADT